MMKKLLLSLSLIVGMASLAAPVATASGVNVWDECAGRDDAICKAADDDDAAVSIAQSIISALLWALGVVSVIMIVVGGIKYATSNGDSSRIKSAKDTIMYAVIGLAVAILAQAIVLFVAGAVT